MPPKSTPKCVNCEKTECLLWRTVEEGEICNDCYQLRESEVDKERKEEHVAEIEEKANLRGSNDNKNDSKASTATAIATTGAIPLSDEKKLRKSTRSTRFKAKATVVAPTSANTNGSTAATPTVSKVQTKGRNRRSMFKKQPMKMPIIQTATRFVQSTFYKNYYMQIGDIVSLVDSEDNVYYAQIRGLLVDDYCEKSAFLTWLIPTQASPDPKEKFDPATYLIGPDEELSRKLSYMEFVMHAPSNYYFDRTTPFPLPDAMDIDVSKAGYVWTTLPEYQRKRTETA